MTPEFHFDFGSPNAYLSHLVLPTIEQRVGVRFEYVPVLLGGVFKLTNNRSPMESFANVRNKLAYERLEMERFIRRNGIARFEFNPFFPLNTLTLMRGAIAARRLGIFDRYIALAFDHMWSEPKNMNDLDIFRAVLTQGGLNAEALLQLAQEPSVKQELMTNTERSVERGAFGSPTFFVGDEMFFGKDRLIDVEEALAQQNG